MSVYDKIRVLWIDDREEMDGYPEGQISPPEFKQWFKIVHPVSGDEALSFRSANEFVPVLHKFWFEDEDSILPAEIIATDYNLSKRAGVAVLDQTVEEVDRDLNDLEGDDDLINFKIEDTFSSNFPRSVNFEGLLISLFYATLTYKHPSTIVPMTRYLSEMPTEVQTLHTLVEPFLGVDFQYIGIENRRWANILKEGVKHLRGRISTLSEEQEIVIAFNDMKAIINSDGSHPVLTVQSQFAIRKFPVEGLFIDFKETERAREIKKWAENLFEKVVSRTDFNIASQIVDELWSFYTAEEGTSEWKQMYDRQLLSSLLREGRQDKTVEELKQRCGVKGKTCQISNEIRDKKQSDEIRRLVVVLMVFRLITHMIRVKNKIDEMELPIGYPKLLENDLWHALFPLPINPVILPECTPSYRDNNWEKFLSRLNLSIPDVLRGKTCLADGTLKGLKPSERYLLRTLAICERDLVYNNKLEKSVFYDYMPARLLLWGGDSEM